ncbi:di-trans,poly-cis-decaprenylcistransferase [Candidatus Saccharibacteria bacterium 47-87]|nr:di-trans,poly-cis-decaprenylcistransferase [Candidatus Saccharibacteria bacterium]OJU96792.1 MAG: di-trans,poly-cis-decaprenylcistransferase [Candidatus Saccharibacteria bacterium 47-87]
MSEKTATPLPAHIGYIVDGNRRWAKTHGLPVYEGHLAGYNALKEVAIATIEAGVPYVSAYIFSTENWQRSADEVKKLLGLVLRLVTSDVPEFQRRNIRLRLMGSRENVPAKILKAIDKAEAATANNTAGTIILGFNYGGQIEVAEAVKKIVQSGVAAEAITVDTIAEALYVPDVPPADLIVRTSGEQRLSNFLLWRSAYSELLFLKKSWPDMTKEDVDAIMKEYAKRQRRFGA